jgi:predicted nucleic acid-binding protein
MSDAILDTSIVIDLLRGDSRAVSWYSGLGRQRLAITPIVWLETVQGAPYKVKRDKIIQYLRRFYMEHPTPDDNRWAMRQFAQYRLSNSVDFPDVVIASVAVRLNVPLYTLNIKQYAPLPNVNEIRPY